MTIPAEELRSLIYAREFLSQLATGKAMKISELRKECFIRLRHFPHESLIEDMWKERIAEYENMLNQ